MDIGVVLVVRVGQAFSAIRRGVGGRGGGRVCPNSIY